jgi:hypothetical protein
VQELGLRWRKEVQAVLRETEPDPPLFAFLLTKLETAADVTVRTPPAPARHFCREHRPRPRVPFRARYVGGPEAICRAWTEPVRRASD